MGALIENCEDSARMKLFAKLGITEESLKADVEYLMHWMEKQPHLPNMPHVNLKEWLANQIIMAKNSMEKTKYSIERYCTVRTMCPEIFIDRDIINNQVLSQSFENLTISYLPGLTPRLHKVCIVRIETPESEEFNFESHMKRCLMVMEYYLKEGLDFTGFHIVFDLENFRLSHLGRFNLCLMKIMSLAMKAYPVSFAVINLINYPTFVEKAIAIFKPFISEKLLSRVILMKDTDELRKVIGNVPLPVEYNGTLMTQKESSDLMKQNLINIREYILKCDSIKCNEVKRNDDKMKCYQEMDDGIAGSFRKLTVD